MEYLEGETLAERLTKGPLPTDEVLRYATEIADALDKAHRQGIVHRDLKPGNNILTSAGTKLLDFGLAKLKPATEGPTGGADGAADAECGVDGAGNDPGDAPIHGAEQLDGKEADARTDLFALGAILYEMVTGKKAFEGEGQASLIHAIMGVDQPAMSTFHPMTPPALDHVVATCLAKRPDDRWQSAGDVGRHLTSITEGGSQPSVAAAVTGACLTASGLAARSAHSSRLRSCGGPWPLIVGVSVWSVMRPPAPRVGRFVIPLPAPETMRVSVGRVGTSSSLPMVARWSTRPLSEDP